MLSKPQQLTVRRTRRHVNPSSLPVKGNSENERLTPYPPPTPKPVQSSETPDEISNDSTKQSNLSYNTSQTKLGRVVKPPKRFVFCEV